MKTLANLALVCTLGCGSSTPANIDASTHDAARDAKVFLDSAGPTLTVKNYEAWCSISVNGAAASVAASQSMPITQAGTINLTAAPNNTIPNSFILGPTPWHLTAGDTGTGDPGTVTGTGSTAVSATTVVVSATASKCVWACCPFTNGTGCSGITNAQAGCN